MRVIVVTHQNVSSHAFFHDVISICSLGHVFPSPGYVTEKISVFFAELNDTPGARELDHDERLEVVALTADEFRAMMKRGEVSDGKTLAMWALFEAMKI